MARALRGLLVRLQESWHRLGSGSGCREAFGVRRMPALWISTARGGFKSAGIRRTPNASRVRLTFCHSATFLRRNAPSVSALLRCISAAYLVGVSPLFTVPLTGMLLAGCEKSSQDSSTKTTANNTKISDSKPLEITTKSGVEMVYLPGGEFMMGRDRGNADEAPAHKVKLSPFLMDKFEVTHDMFTKAQLPNPSHWQDNT